MQESAPPVAKRTRPLFWRWLAVTCGLILVGWFLARFLAMSEAIERLDRDSRWKEAAYRGVAGYFHAAYNGSEISPFSRCTYILETPGKAIVWGAIDRIDTKKLLDGDSFKATVEIAHYSQGILGTVDDMNIHGLRESIGSGLPPDQR